MYFNGSSNFQHPMANCKCLARRVRNSLSEHTEKSNPPGVKAVTGAGILIRRARPDANHGGYCSRKADRQRFGAVVTLISRCQDPLSSGSRTNRLSSALEPVLYAVTR